MLTPGAHVAGYRIEAVVGRGGMGVVYEATQVELDRRVAFKVLTPELERDERFFARFRREGRLQASIEHPHIVPVYEAGQSPVGLFLAMRLIRGVDLKALLRRETVDPGRAMSILSPIGDALDAAHAAGLLHRDVKPQNILVGPDDHAFLADFGLGKVAGLTGLTESGELAGTPAYISPEQIKGEPATAASDVYSFAAVLYEALTGEVPFVREGDAATLFAHLNDEPPPASGRRRGLVEAVDPVLARGLAKDPASRHPSAGALAGNVASALAIEVPTVPGPAPAVRGARALAAARTRVPEGGALAEAGLSVGRSGPGNAPPAAARGAGPGDGPPAAATPPRDDPSPPRRARRVLLAVGAALLLLAGGAAALLLSQASEPSAEDKDRTRASRSPGAPQAPDKSATIERSEVSVPELAGLPVDRAKRRAGQAGLELSVRRAYDDSPEGTVLSQRPGAGARVAPKSVIRLAVSRGPAPLSPDSRLTIDGIGPVRVGMSVEEVQAAGTRLSEVGGNGGCRYWKPVDGPAGVSFMATEGVIARVDVSSPTVSTLSGIRVGSTGKEVKSTYGRLIEPRRNEYDPQGEYLYFVPQDGSDGRMVFETGGEDRVDAIRAGRKPEVDFIEGCA